jgi:2,5-diamino-6-(ribosylamino)-4(3H)-pyrimidinone 5'-phosphate reductase
METEPNQAHTSTDTGRGVEALPRVILFNAVSVDGRLDWFQADQAVFYSLIDTWQEDCTLAGANTILAATREAPPETGTPSLQAEAGDTRPVLAVPDSRGRVRTWHLLRQWNYWGRFVAICSATTPQDYLEYLAARDIDVIMAGEDHVDFGRALAELRSRYVVGTVRVDSGGTLNGILLRAGLASEVSVLVFPSLVGGETPKSMYRAPDLAGPEGVIPLDLISANTLEGGLVWLRYSVRK